MVEPESDYSREVEVEAVQPPIAAPSDAELPVPISRAFSVSPLHSAAAVLYAAQLVPTYAIVYWLSYTAVENAVLRSAGDLIFRMLRPPSARRA